MFTEFNRIFSLEVDLKNLEVTYNSKALYTNVDLNTSTMMIKMSLDQNALDLTGKTVNAFIKTGIDKNITMQRCEILEATEGIIGLDFKSSALKTGTNTFFLEIKSENEEIINSPLITYKVVELFDTYSSVEGDNNVSILTELITEVDIAKGSVEVLKNEIAEQERQREEAETSRKNNESSRIQAETNRTNSESTRVANENNRKQAESTRESNETKRVNAENLRESAENTRKQEETKRSQNESLRVESEKERVLSYEEIKNNNAIFKEQMNTDFGNAKTDYFGEEHPNVVERLNSDFDNLHQRMNDSSLLPYEGTSIKADNSYYGLTKDMVVKGRTLQNLHKPNPYSFAISGCEPNIDFVTTNKANEIIIEKLTNTIPKYAYINCGKVDVSKLKPNTKYTVVFEEIENVNRVALHGGDTGNILAHITTINNNKALLTTISDFSTINTQSVIVYIYADSYNTNTRLKVKNVMILEGDHTNTPIEELPFGEGIYSVGENEVTEDGRYKISGKSCGKNLFNKNNIINYANLNGDKPYVGENALSVYIKCKPNTTYAIKRYYGSSNRFGVYSGKYNPKDGSAYNCTGQFLIISTSNDQPKMVHTTKFGDDILWVYCTQQNDSLEDLVIQLEEGTVVTGYEPYQESTYSYILDEPLRSLPNGVADTIEGNKVIRRIGKVVLDGSENYSLETSVDGAHNYLDIENIDLPFKVKDTYVYNDQLCDKLKIANGYGTPFSIWLFCNLGNKIKSLRIAPSNTLSTKEEMVNWLKNNPLTLYYELEEPIITELDETLQLKSFNGTTHIISDNYLMPTVSAKIPSDVQAVVSSLITENKELTEEVSTLSVENEELKQTNEIQDELIDINMCATDEMYVLLEPLLAQSISTMSLEREVSKMVDLYVAMIQRGLKTIEQVPERYREQVREVLEQLEK